MKKTTTTREYDEEGRVVKETVVEEESRPVTINPPHRPFERTEPYPGPPWWANPVIS